jgi:UDP-glucose 4-epimerase
MWATQLSPAPPELLDFLRYLCVADGSRAAEVLGFRPTYHVRDAATEMFGVLDTDATLFRRAFG